MNFKASLNGCLILSFVAISACTPGPSGSSSSKLSVGAVLKSDMPAERKSEELALQAEQLMTAQGLEQSKKVVELALEQDPSNVRAQLIKVLIAPLLEMKGIVARVRPIAEKNPKLLKSYLEQVEIIKNSKKDSSFKNFLLVGQPDLQDEAKLQAQMDSLIRTFDAMRIFMKEIQIDEITVKANPFLIPNLNRRFAEACVIKETENLEFELICPDSSKRSDVTLNQADFLRLKDMASMYQLYFSLYASYDLTGMLEVIQQIDPEAQVTAQKISDELLKKPRFGKLRNQKYLQQVPALGLDYVSGLRWSMANFSTLCPKGQDDPTNRPGMFVNTGICIHTFFEPYVQVLESVLKGEPYELVSERNGQSHTTKVEINRFFAKPIDNLKTLGPIQFDRCNQAINFGDSTLAGIFPQSDANVVLPLRIACSK